MRITEKRGKNKERWKGRKDNPTHSKAVQEDREAEELPYWLENVTGSWVYVRIIHKTPNWKQLACSKLTESISQLCFSQTTEHYSLIKTPEKEQLIYATRQMHLKNLVPGLTKTFPTCSYSKISFLGSKEEAKLVYSDRHQSDNCLPGTDKQKEAWKTTGVMDVFFTSPALLLRCMDPLSKAHQTVRLRSAPCTVQNSAHT